MPHELHPAAELISVSAVLLRNLIGPWRDAGRGVPGILAGAGASLCHATSHLRRALEDGICIVGAVPTAAEPLAAGGAIASFAIGVEAHRSILSEAAAHRHVREAFLVDVEPPPGVFLEAWSALLRAPSVLVYLTLRALGCDPVILTGLDLSFPDGVVHAAGHPVDLDWAAELNPFHTVESLHFAAATIDAGARLAVERSGGPVATRAAFFEELNLLEAAVSEDNRAGLRTVDADPRGISKHGAVAGRVEASIPHRGAVLLPPWPGLRPADGVHRLGRSANGDAATSREGMIRVSASATRVSVSATRVAAVVAIDPEIGGTGIPRHVDAELASRPVLHWTLERLGRVKGIESIILLVPPDFDVRPLFDPRRIGRSVEIDVCAGGPFPPEQEALRISRLWSDTAWRGGIGGSASHDEIVAPAATLAALERRNLDAALLCGPDWPLVMVEGLGGCDSLVDRFRSSGGRLDPVFAPGPPGLATCVVGRGALGQLAARSGPITLGGLYRSLPRPDRDPRCMPPVSRIRRSLVRAIFDSARAKLRMRRAIEPMVADTLLDDGVVGVGGWAAVLGMEHQMFQLPPAFAPQHLVIELNTGRRGSGSASPHRLGSIQRPPMTRRMLERLLEEVEAPRDAVITFGHVGDPLWHAELPDFIRMAKDAGARGVHVRTELLADARRIDAMLEAAPDVISVDLHGATKPTYQTLMGLASFEVALSNLERVARSRRQTSGSDPRFALPLVCVRMQRRAESLPELSRFVELWERVAGSAVIEGIPLYAPDPERLSDPLLPAPAPTEAVIREGLRRMVVLSDGRIPICELDLLGERTLGSVARGGVVELWRDLVSRRRQILRENGADHPELRCWQP